MLKKGIAEMSHLDVDRFAKISRFYRLDPRVKLICTIALVVVLAFITDLLPLLLMAAFVLGLVLSSRVPIKHMARNFAFALMFIAFASAVMLLTSGWMAALTIFIRISTSVLALLLLVSTTPFFRLMRGFQALRMPQVLTGLIMFTYRFIFILLEEMERMRMARMARGFSGGTSILDRTAFKTLSATIGMVFVRANLRATNIYDALLSRGYTGEIRTMGQLEVRGIDGAFAAAFVIMMMFTIVLQVGVVHWTL